jgi:DNA-binding beta-propeller fold protein YncE
VEHYWKLEGGEEPTGLAIDIKNQRLFSVCGNKKMVIVDGQSGKTLTTIAIGDHCDGVAFDASLKRAYASNGEGSVTVVQEENPGSFNLLETLPTQKGAKTITSNSQNGHFYLPVAEFNPAKDNEKPQVIPGTFKVLEYGLVTKP